MNVIYYWIIKYKKKINNNYLNEFKGYNNINIII